MREYLDGKGGRNRHSARNSLKIPILSGIIVLLLATWAGMTWLGRTALVPTDPDTLCPREKPPSEILVLLLDMSDEYSEPQRLQIRNELERFRSGLKQFGLVEVYAVDRNGERVTKPLLHICNPGSDVDVNRLYQNPGLARKRWATFAAKLDGELARLLKSNESDTSPIFEAIQSTALRTFSLPEHDGLPKQLVLVSDLLQNVPGKFSHYQDDVSFSQFQDSKYFADTRADLTGVNVHLAYLLRSSSLQDADHLMFWEQYFAAQGAAVQSVVPIFGAQ